MNVKTQVNVDALLEVMGSANISKAELTRRSKLHRNTIGKILGRVDDYHKSVSLETIGALVAGLNLILLESNLPLYNPIDFIESEGFPAPHMDAPALTGDLMPA